jgi:hypothetical protein
VLEQNHVKVCGSQHAQETVSANNIAGILKNWADTFGGSDVPNFEKKTNQNRCRKHRDYRTSNRRKSVQNRWKSVQNR